MKTLKFKVGDKVRVKSLEWYNENKDVFGDIINDYVYIFPDKMAKFCGKILEITETTKDYYITEGNNYCWMDWMLEDKVITEERQEVEELNKNDMETKEMTKGEVLEYLKDTKILCTSTEETATVQEKLFELGITWISYGKDVRKNRYLLFIGKQGEIAYCSNIETWMQDINRRIEPSEILAIQIKEENPKFDPKTLQPFDKVLVRENDKYKEWFARFFEYYGEGKFYTTSGTSWKYCIPYNDETKHLHGTTEDAPDFYRI